MLGFFRRLVKSRVGTFLALLLLLVIGLAFAAGDIERHLVSGNLFGTDSTAIEADGATLSANDLASRQQRVFDNARRQNPALTMDGYFSQGGFETITDQLADSVALTAFADRTGMRISKKLIDADIASNPAFAGANGQFSQTTYRDILARERVNETALRDDVKRQIVERFLLGPAGGGATPPKDMALRYALMFLERREGRLAAVPSAAFVPKTAPDAAAVARFYNTAKARFALPEQRSVRYAVADAATIGARATPTDADIARYYQANAAAYAAKETRKVTQLVLPTEGAARKVASGLGGGSLDAAAKAAGLATTTLGPLDRAGLALQTSDAAAGQIFAAARGATIGPVKTGLGWALFRVEEVQTTPARTLASARAEIATAVAQAKLKETLSDIAAKLDEQIGNGATFDQAVKSAGLTATQTPLLTADGQVSGAPAQTPPNADFAGLAKAAFSMEADDDPQVVQLVPDQKIALVAVGKVQPSGPPPLAAIRPLVERAYLLSQGLAKAKAAATAIQAKIQGGTDLAAAIAAAGVPLPPAQPVGATRADLSRAGQQVPRPLVELFSMKKGTVRLLPLPNDMGYAVLQLDRITPGNMAAAPQVLPMTRSGLAQALSEEYQAQFTRALSAYVGVKRHDAVIARVAADLRKGSTPQADQ